jgi:putative ABC transport system permease protein
VPLRLAAHVGTDGDPSTVAARLARAIGALDASLMVEGRSLADVSGSALALQRIVTLVLSIAGLMAVGMAMMGVYGVLAYLVHLRTRELGIRVALGAAPGALLRETMAEGLRMAAPGALVGLACGAALAFTARSLLVGVAPLDPVALGAALALMAGAVSAAAFVPARRAAGIDPIVSLRQE